MSDRERELREQREAERLLALLREQPEAEPRPEFLEKLQRDFRAGSIESPYERATVSRGVWSRFREGWTAPSLRPIGAGVMALAAAVALIAWANSGKTFGSFTTSGDGDVVIGSKVLALSDRAAIESELRPGTTIELRGDMSTMLNLFYGDDYALQVTTGSRLVVPRSPRRWFGRQSDFAVFAGETRVVTGPGFPGARLAITTSNAQVEVIGTTFAVIADADSTCVCVLDGTAQLAMGTAPPMPVPPMMRGTVRMPDGATTMEPIRPMEELKLKELRTAAMPMLESR